MMQCPFSTHAHDRLASRQRSTVALGIVSEAGPITVGSIYHPQVKPSEALRILGQATSHNWQATAPSPRSNSARDTLSP